MPEIKERYILELTILDSEEACIFLNELNQKLIKFFKYLDYRNQRDIHELTLIEDLPQVYPFTSSYQYSTLYILADWIFDGLEEKLLDYNLSREEKSYVLKNLSISKDKILFVD